MSALYAAPAFSRTFRVSAPARAGDYIRCFSIALWFSSMVAVFWWRGDWAATIDPSTRGLSLAVFAVGMGLAGLAHLSLGLPKLLSSPYLPPFGGLKEGLTVGFFMLMLVLSPRSLTNVSSASYAILGYATFCLCSWFWFNHPVAFRKMMVLTAGMLLLLLVALILRHGFARGGVGGINRNRFASVGFVAIIAATFTRHWIKWPLYAAAVILMILVTSRSSILSSCIFLGVYTVLFHGAGKAAKYVLPSALLVLAVILVGRAREHGNDVITNDLMRVHDKARGVGSGLTGRVERWMEGLELFRLRPWVGYGFRSRTNSSVETKSAHSGYINLLLDAGLIGAALLGGAVIVDVVGRTRRIFEARRYLRFGTFDEQQSFLFTVNCIAVAVYVVMGAVWVVEPIYLNFGHPLTAIFILMAASPRLQPPDPYARGYA